MKLSATAQRDTNNQEIKVILCIRAFLPAIKGQIVDTDDLSLTECH